MNIAKSARVNNKSPLSPFNGDPEGVNGMRENANKSVKLNRDLDTYVQKALEQDRPVKIGWGRAGDERPKEGEFGVLTHLPKGARVLCLGNLGDCVGAANRGGTMTLRGSAGSMLGSYHDSGKTVVEKDVGDKVGFEMSGGEISIQGSAGNDVGAGMTDGAIIIRGHTENKPGAGMKGGSILVMGSVGSDPGIGMRGGRIIISGSCPPPPEGVEMRSIKKSEISEFSKILDPMGLSLNEDSLVLEPSNILPEIESKQKRFIEERFEKIALHPNDGALADHSPLDYYSLLVPGDSESEGVLLRLPWIISCQSTNDDKQWNGVDVTAIVRKNPRRNDFLIVGRNEFVDSIEFLGDCAGLIFDITEFAGSNDAEIEALLISLRSRMSDNSLVMLRGEIGRIEHLFRMVMELELDGAVVDCSSSSGSKLPSALPRIGISSKGMGISGSGKFIMLEIDQEPDAKDLMIAIAAGCTALVSPLNGSEPGETMGEIENSLRGLMREIGVDRIERVGRRNLRAKDYETAAISGLRLIGYDRPLKMWLDLR